MCWGDTHTKTWGASSVNPYAKAPLQGCDCGALSAKDFELIPSLNAAIADRDAKIALLEAVRAAGDAMAERADDLAYAVEQGPIGSASEWRFISRDTAQILKHEVTAYREAAARLDRGTVRT